MDKVPPDKSPYIPSDSDRGTLDEMLKSIFPGPVIVHNDAALKLQDWETKLAVKQLLGSLGLRMSQRWATKGSFAIAGQCAPHQVVRIVAEDSDRRAAIALPTVLQPLATYRTHGMRVDIMPEVIGHPEAKITRDEIIDLLRATAHAGYIFGDPQRANIGRLYNGVPIILDPGYMTPISEIDKIVNGQRGVVHLAGSFYGYIPDKADYQTIQKQLRQWQSEPVTINYAAEQEKHCKHFGLEIGKVSGVFSSEKVDGYRAVLNVDPKRDSVLTHAMLEGRHDKNSWNALMDEALPILENEGVDAWRSYIQRQSQERGRKKE